MTPQIGDCLVIWSMPWRTSSIIDYVSDGNPCHHCAVVAPPPLWDFSSPSICVYEAWVPESRYTSWEDYKAVMFLWASNWRYKNKKDKFKCEVFRYTSISQEQLIRLHAASMALLDFKYNMFLNWLNDKPSLHCSELASKATVSAGLTERADYPSLNMGRVTPWDWRKSLVKHGAELVETLTLEDLNTGIAR